MNTATFIAFLSAVAVLVVGGLILDQAKRYLKKREELAEKNSKIIEALSMQIGVINVKVNSGTAAIRATLSDSDFKKYNDAYKEEYTIGMDTMKIFLKTNGAAK